MTEATGDVGALLRSLAPQVLGAVLRRYRNFDTAEDAVQEALLAAALAWPESGMPENPRAWLVQVAYRRLTDQVRSGRARQKREEQVAEAFEHEQSLLAATGEPATLDGEGDDTLLLLFMSCHPSLSQTSAIALTLRSVGGLTTGEIAKAFLVPEATMAQRISRAKKSIQESGVPFERPTPSEWPQRLNTVLHVLYLVFNEGYAASNGAQLLRSDLANEAIRLAREVRRLLPDDVEVSGLLSLMLLTDARRHARTGPDGELVSLEEQDRSLWDRAEIAEGVALVSEALPKQQLGPYQLQAAIAAVHDEAPRVEDTDWREIFALYGVLESMTDNPVVVLNRIVAFSMVNGPRAGLERLAELARDPRLAGNHRVEAVRAHLFERAGEPDEAIRGYRAAASQTTSLPEQRYLIARAARLEAQGR